MSFFSSRCRRSSEHAPGLTSLVDRSVHRACRSCDLEAPSSRTSLRCACTCVAQAAWKPRKQHFRNRLVYRLGSALLEALVLASRTQLQSRIRVVLQSGYRKGFVRSDSPYEWVYNFYRELLSDNFVLPSGTVSGRGVVALS